MVKDTDKLAMGQELHVTTPHAIEGVLKQPPDSWISNAHLTHYQSLLLNLTRILFKPPTTLNPATLLPNPDWDPPLCMTVKKFWHRCTESELISRTSHCRMRMPPGTRTAAVSRRRNQIHGGSRNHGNRDRLGRAIGSRNIGSTGRTDHTGQGADHGRR